MNWNAWSSSGPNQADLTKENSSHHKNSGKCFQNHKIFLLHIHNSSRTMHMHLLSFAIASGESNCRSLFSPIEIVNTFDGAVVAVYMTKKIFVEISIIFSKYYKKNGKRNIKIIFTTAHDTNWLTCCC